MAYPGNVISLDERRRALGATPPSPPGGGDGGGGGGSRMAGEALAWLKPHLDDAGKFLMRPRVIGGGAALAGIGALLAAANEANTQDPTLSGLQAAARPVGAGVGQLATTAAGTGLGFVLGGPVGAAIGGTLGSLLPGADLGAGIAGGLAGVVEPSEMDKQIRDYKKQQRAQMEMELERLPIARALAQEQLANEAKAARLQEAINAQARASQALWSGLNYTAPSGAEIYGTVI